VNGPVLDHIGIAVSSLEGVRRFYEALGFTIDGVEDVPSQMVRVGFIPVGDGKIELLEATSEDSPIAGFLKKKGGGLHHLCFRVPDIEAAMKRLRGEGFRLLSDEPIEGAHHCRVCFVHPKSSGGVLIELSQPKSPEHRNTD